MKKAVVTAAMAAALSLAVTGSAFAAGWQQAEDGRWWYTVNDDNSEWHKNGWQEIGGKWYYFDEIGWMLSDTTTPDGYYVDASGAWVQDGGAAAGSAGAAASEETQAAAETQAAETPAAETQAAETQAAGTTTEIPAADISLTRVTMNYEYTKYLGRNLKEIAFMSGTKTDGYAYAKEGQGDLWASFSALSAAFKFDAHIKGNSYKDNAGQKVENKNVKIMEVASSNPGDFFIYTGTLNTDSLVASLDPTEVSYVTAPEWTDGSPMGYEDLAVMYFHHNDLNYEAWYTAADHAVKHVFVWRGERY